MNIRHTEEQLTTLTVGVASQEAGRKPLHVELPRSDVQKSKNIRKFKVWDKMLKDVSNA